jgi:hypothetical protein
VNQDLVTNPTEHRTGLWHFLGLEAERRRLDQPIPALRAGAGLVIRRSLTWVTVRRVVNPDVHVEQLGRAQLLLGRVQDPLDVRLPQPVQARGDAQPACSVVVTQLELVMPGEKLRRDHDVEQAGVEKHVLRLLALGVGVVVQDEDFLGHGCLCDGGPIRSRSSSERRTAASGAISD